MENHIIYTLNFFEPTWACISSTQQARQFLFQLQSLQSTYYVKAFLLQASFGGPSGFMTFLLLMLLGLISYVAIARGPETIRKPWQTFLDGVQISTNDFYEAIRAGLEERNITHVTITERSFLESHVFSAMRVYLRIAQNEYVYYVCAAPYGTGTFFSSWLVIKGENMLEQIPLLSKLAGKDRRNKTFYQMDTEAMFRSAVHATVTTVVDTMATAKGLRGLTELDRQIAKN